MGLFDKLKEKGRGIVTAAKPEEGVAVQPIDELRRQLLAISGKGIQAGEDEGEIVISWSAKVASSGEGGGEYEYLYRAIRLGLDDGEHAASGLCFKTSTDAEVGLCGFSASKNWEKGQHIGSESVHVLAWLGPHQTEGGADESGYKFSWSDLRDPVIEAVTGAGWTYKPKKI
jgi:hypothetical protein